MGYEDEREHLLSNESGDPQHRPGRAVVLETAEYSGDPSPKVSGPDEVEEAEPAVEGDPTEDLTTVCETFWNICNTIQGLPILAIPYTFKSGGWWSLITLAVVAIASLYTSRVLVKSLYEIRDGIKVRVRSRIFLKVARLLSLQPEILAKN